MKLNLRDFFWLILVCSLIVAWMMDRKSIQSQAASEQSRASARIAQLESERMTLAEAMALVPIHVGPDTAPRPKPNLP